MYSDLPVIVDDGVKAVSYCEHSTVSKLVTDGGLDELVRLQVDRCRGFIQDQNLGVAEEGSRQAHQLPLANTGEKYLRYSPLWQVATRLINSGKNYLRRSEEKGKM